MSSMNNLFHTDHFTLHRLTEGVYSAIATEDGAGFSNAGIIDLGDQTLIFDAFENPQATEDLLKACLQLTQRKPAMVIISHFHPDHWAGLQVFAGCTILATHVTRQEMVPIAKELALESKDPSWIEKDIQRTEASLAAETNPLKRKNLRNYLARQCHTLKALPTLVPTLPNLTFDGKIIFHGTHRSAELIATDKGHTNSDCILRLPQDRVAFIGDIGFFQSQPFMPNGYPSEWVALLDDMTSWDIETFIPGHGPLGNKEDLHLEVKYIQAVDSLVQSVVQAGGTVKNALRQTLPAPFDEWQKIGSRFEANVRALFKRQTKSAKSP